MPLSAEVITRLEDAFHANVAEGREVGASVSVWSGDDDCLTLSAGSCDRAQTRPWAHDTLVPVWSCTKGPAAAAVHLALAEAGVPLETPVARLWPAFAANGKETLTISDVLSHQAGLASLDRSVAVSDYAAVVAALEAQAPAWRIGEGHGYHPRTYGFLLDEILRRLTGAESLGAYWNERFAKPLGIDVWIGLPESEHHRVATLYPGRMADTSDEEARFYAAFGKPSSLTARAFASPKGLHAVSDFNRSEVWRLGYPAMGGVASASGLAKFYAFLASGALHEGSPWFPPTSLDAMQATLAQGDDLVLLRPTAFSAGFLKDPVGADGQKTRRLFGPNLEAFGQPGAGGSLAFADPHAGIGFAYVMNQMERSVFPTEKAMRLVRALYSEIPESF